MRVMFDGPLLLAVLGGRGAWKAENGAGDGQMARRVRRLGAAGGGGGVAGTGRVEVGVIAVEATAAASIAAPRRRRSYVTLKRNPICADEKEG